MKFGNEKELANFIKSLGGELWLVGGSIRDEIMGNPASDRDYVVTGMRVEQVSFEKIVGSDFPVFLVDIGSEKCEVALARTENKSGSGYHGFTFFSDPSVTIVQDLARRDLTINAMAKNVLTGDIVDPFNARTHIAARILKHTTGAFADDPLRVYRIARFAAKFGFAVHGETAQMMKSLRDELPALKAERVLKEFEKVLALENARVFFDVLKSVDLLHIHFPEIAALDVPDKHDGTTYNHTMNLLRYARSSRMRFALLVHDFGKALTPKENHPAHYGHESLGKQPVIDFCERLRIPNDFKKFGLLCAENHMRLKRLDEMRPGKIVKLVLANNGAIMDLLEMSFIDSARREGGDFELEAKRFSGFGEIVRIAMQSAKEINGDTLITEGFEPSPTFGETLLSRRIERFKHLVSHD